MALFPGCWRRCRNGAIKVKRVYESPELVEGSRWLRGLKKEILRGAVWVKDVAPSDALPRWYGHDPRKCKEFRRRYFAELDGKREAWEPILEAARRGGLVLLYSARDAEHNNAVALARLSGRQDQDKERLIGTYPLLSSGVSHRGRYKRVP